MKRIAFFLVLMFGISSLGWDCNGGGGGGDKPPAAAGGAPVADAGPPPTGAMIPLTVPPGGTVNVYCGGGGACPSRAAPPAPAAPPRGWVPPAPRGAPDSRYVLVERYDRDRQAQAQINGQLAGGLIVVSAAAAKADRKADVLAADMTDIKADLTEVRPPAAGGKAPPADQTAAAEKAAAYWAQFGQ